MIKIIQLENRYRCDEKTSCPNHQHDENGLLEVAFQSEWKYNGQVTIDRDIGQNENT